jgi:hypothetical protein
MFENIVCDFVTNQWECRKFESYKIKSAKNLCLSAKVKSLNFAVVIFRSNIIFSTAKLAQFLKNSNSDHVTIANRIIAYFNDIKILVIEFSKNSSEIFFSANDAAFANDELIRKSSDDYLFKLYDDSID